MHADLSLCNVPEFLFTCKRMIFLLKKELVKFDCMMASLLCDIKAQEEETVQSLSPTRNNQEPESELKRLSSSTTVTFGEPGAQASVSPVAGTGRRLLGNVCCVFFVVAITSFVTVIEERNDCWNMFQSLGYLGTHSIPS